MTTRLDALTPEQKAALCDWVAQLYGGYGKQLSCGQFETIYGPTTQQDCVDNMTATSCPATVSDSEACEKDANCENNGLAPSCAPILADTCQ